MKLPRQVRVAGHPVKINLAKLPNHMGDYTHRDGVINIANDMCPSQQAATLLHEILHCCWRSAYITRKTPEETAVRALEQVLYQVIRDNPKIIKWIQEAK